MIKHNNNSFSSVYDETTVIGKIMKGTLLLYDSWKKLIASGVPPLTLLKCKGVDLVDYKIYGNSVQNGTPTPDTPIEVQSVGEKTKNLFNLEDHTTLILGYNSQIISSWVKIEDGILSNTCDLYNGGAYLVSENSYGLEAGTYTISGKVRNSTGKIGTGIIWDDGSKNMNQNIVVGVSSEWTNFSYTFSITQFKWVTGVYFQNHGTQSKSNVQFTELMIKKSSVATEYEPYGKYKIPVTVRGKNLYIPTKTNLTQNGVTFTMNDDNTFTVNGTPTANAYFHIGSRFAIDTDKKYYLSGGGEKASLSAQLFVNGVQKNTVTVNTGVLEIPTTYGNEPVNEINLVINAKAGFVFENEVVKPMLSYIETDEYEPYVESITKNIYLDEPLRSIGEFADYIDFENQKVIRKIGEYAFTGDETFTKYSEQNYYNNGSVFDIFYPMGATLIYGFCNKAPRDFSKTPATIVRDYLGHVNTNRGIEFRNTNDNWGFTGSTVKEFKEWLKLQYETNNPIILNYIKKNFTETKIELSNIPTHKGTTVIDVGTTIEPSNMEVTYLGKK